VVCMAFRWLRPRRTSLIVVEALSVLLAEPLSIDHAFEENTRTVFGVAGSFVERLLNGKAGIKTDAINKDESLLVSKSEICSYKSAEAGR